MAKNIWEGTDGAPVSSFNIGTDRRDLNVADKILELQPSETPFLVIGDKTSVGTAKSLEETWYDDDLAPWWTEAADDYLIDATTIILVDGSIVKAKDLIKNTTTGEVMLVTAVSGNDVTVERAVGDETDGNGTAAAAGAAGDNFMRMGNAMEENSLSPDPRATQPNKYYNYVEIKRTPFSGSIEDLNEDKETTEDERKRLQRRKAIEHKLDLERSYVFGERNEIIAEKRRTLGGLFQFLDNQFDTIGGVLTEALFEAVLEDAFKYGSKEKILITSPRVGSAINQFARDNIEVRSGETYYGLKIAEYISFHGTLYVATSHMFERDYLGMGAILDMENIDILPYGGFSTTLRANLQEEDRLGWKDEYLTMSTLRVRLNKTHRVLDGITF